MASYYYLIASLPELKTDGGMPLTYSEFLSLCRSNVSESKYELLKNLTLSSTEGPLVSEWAKFYGGLMRELNYQRSTALGRSYSPPEEKDMVTSQVVAGVLAARNPLEAEKILLDYEFENLDAIMGLHIFDDYVLFGYAIKLKLLERLTSFDREKGREEFRSLFDGIQRRVYSL
jgi:hypothetical protein